MIFSEVSGFVRGHFLSLLKQMALEMEVLLQGSKPHMVPACAVDIVGNIQMLTGVFHGRGRVFLQSYLKQGVPKGTQARESLSPKAVVLQSHCN